MSLIYRVFWLSVAVIMASFYIALATGALFCLALLIRLLITL